MMMMKSTQAFVYVWVFLSVGKMDGRFGAASAGIQACCALILPVDLHFKPRFWSRLSRTTAPSGSSGLGTLGSVARVTDLHKSQNKL